MRSVIVLLLAAGVAVLAAGCGGGDRAGDHAGGASDSAPAARTPTEVVATAEQRLGASFAGGFVNPAGDVVVLTTDPGATDRVRALGATVQVVEHSKAALEDWQQRVGAALRPEPPPAVTSWGVDVQRNAVVVNVLAGPPVPPQLQQLVDGSGGAVVLGEARAPVRPLLPGG